MYRKPSYNISTQIYILMISDFSFTKVKVVLNIFQEFTFLVADYRYGSRKSSAFNEGHNHTGESIDILWAYLSIVQSVPSPRVAVILR